VVVEWKAIAAACSRSRLLLADRGDEDDRAQLWVTGHVASDRHGGRSSRARSAASSMDHAPNPRIPCIRISDAIRRRSRTSGYQIVDEFSERERERETITASIAHAAPTQGSAGYYDPKRPNPWDGTAIAS